MAPFAECDAILHELRTDNALTDIDTGDGDGGWIRGGAMDAKRAELMRLANRTYVGNYLAAGIAGRRVEGAEEELRQAVKCDERSIPYEAFEARVAAPGTIGVNMTSLVPAEFSQSAAELLMIGMPRVPSGQHSVPRINASLS